MDKNLKFLIYALAYIPAIISAVYVCSYMWPLLFPAVPYLVALLINAIIALIVVNCIPPLLTLCLVIAFAVLLVLFSIIFKGVHYVYTGLRGGDEEYNLENASLIRQFVNYLQSWVQVGIDNINFAFRKAPDAEAIDNPKAPDIEVPEWDIGEGVFPKHPNPTEGSAVVGAVKEDRSQEGEDTSFIVSAST